MKKLMLFLCVLLMPLGLTATEYFLAPKRVANKIFDHFYENSERAKIIEIRNLDDDHDGNILVVYEWINSE